VHDGTWQFFDPDLTNAVAGWLATENPSPERVDAFDAWCLDVTQTGPPVEGTITSVRDPDLHISNIEAAQVVVTYLAVFQDCRIFLRKISGTR
jgi:hypothetical protein